MNIYFVSESSSMLDKETDGSTAEDHRRRLLTNKLKYFKFWQCQKLQLQSLTRYTEMITE